MTFFGLFLLIYGHGKKRSCETCSTRPYRKVL
jgi:hypothetical protein